jgi:hypothetical protein
MSKNTQSKTTQLGIRIPTELHNILEHERLEALQQGQKVTMTDLVTKYLYAGLGRSPTEVKADVALMPTLDRLTNVLDRLERKL